MKHIKNLYNKIIEIGVSNTFSNLHNKQTRLVNIYTLIGLHASILFYIIDLGFVIKPVSSHIIAYCSVLIKLLVLMFNKYHLFSYAKVTYLIFLFIFINASTLLVNPGVYTEYFFLVVPGICLSIYTKNTIPVVCTVLGICCFAIPYCFFDIYPENHPNKTRIFLVAILFYFMYTIVNYFKKMNLLNEERLKAAYSELEKRKESEFAHLQLKSLKAQMNPHFMFNAMNSIQSLVLKGDKHEAYTYLTKFASLIRENLNMSEKSFVRFDEELSLLKKYLELEALRFRDNFEYEIFGAKKIGDIKIPSMVIQPFIENAIKHGLLHRMKGIKKIKIAFYIEDVFKCVITDNGIGIKASEEINKANQHKEVSFSTKAIQDRLVLLKNYYEADIGVIYEEVTEGTKVIVKIPYTI